MSAFSAPITSLSSGERYTLQRPGIALTLEEFTHEDFDYIRTVSAYYRKPSFLDKWQKMSRNKYECNRSFYRTSINRSQAKGLLKLTQLEMDFND